MFAILFGLSMDYEVFLVTQMQEHYEEHHRPVRAVVEGLANTGRVITSAALIMVFVFTSFVVNGDPIVKEFGVGLAAAIAIDATVVRCLLVPAVMTLLGKAAWWMPRRLDRVTPRISIEGRAYFERRDAEAAPPAEPPAEPAAEPPAAPVPAPVGSGPSRSASRDAARFGGALRPADPAPIARRRDHVPSNHVRIRHATPPPAHRAPAPAARPPPGLPADGGRARGRAGTRDRGEPSRPEHEDAPPPHPMVATAGRSRESAVLARYRSPYARLSASQSGCSVAAP